MANVSTHTGETTKKIKRKKIPLKPSSIYDAYLQPGITISKVKPATDDMKFFYAVEMESRKLNRPYANVLLRASDLQGYRGDIIHNFPIPQQFHYHRTIRRIDPDGTVHIIDQMHHHHTTTIRKLKRWLRNNVFQKETNNG